MGIGLFTCRSYYSLLRGAVSPGRWVEQAKALGYSAVAVADVNRLSGVWDFWRAAQRADVWAMVGVEILVEAEAVEVWERQSGEIAERVSGRGGCCRVAGGGGGRLAVRAKVGAGQRRGRGGGWCCWRKVRGDTGICAG